MSAPKDDSFKKLQRGLTGTRSLIGKSYMEDEGMLAAYLGYYWPVSREQARFCIQAAKRQYGLAPFQRVIDAGSGPGPVAAAFGESGALELNLADKSGKALELAKKKIGFGGKIHTAIIDIAAPEPARLPLWGEADCVSFGHSLNELFALDGDRAVKRAAVLERWAQALGPNGVILAIEPALLNTSRDLLETRNILVDRGWRVLAPCPGRETLPCPALEAGPTHTCHEEFAWKLPPEASRYATSLGLDKDSLKMTWFILSPPHRPQEDTRTLSEVFRVVSDPMLNKAGRIRRLICGAPGRLPLSALPPSPQFDSLGRGDLIRLFHPEIRENGFGITEETKIEKISVLDTPSLLPV